MLSEICSATIEKKRTLFLSFFSFALAIHLCLLYSSRCFGDIQAKRWLYYALKLKANCTFY